MVGAQTVTYVISAQGVDSRSAGPEWLKALRGFIPQKKYR